MLTYLLLSQTLTLLLLEIIKLTTHNNLSFALKEGNFFLKRFLLLRATLNLHSWGRVTWAMDQLYPFVSDWRSDTIVYPKEYVFLSTYSRPPFLMTKGRSKSQFWLLQKEESQDWLSNKAKLLGFYPGDSTLKWGLSWSLSPFLNRPSIKVEKRTFSFYHQ